MEFVSTPEPHFIPGYTGHCPQYNFRVGKTYANLTHKLLIDPCVRHSPKILIECLNGIEIATDKPTLQEIDLIKAHERDGDAVLKFPILPGYDGFIPNLHSKIGVRFLAAATAGVAEHEKYMQKLKCERRKLQHRRYIQSGEEMTTNEKASKTLPCVTIKTVTSDDADKIPYSKHTPPHFMKDENAEKYIMKGYAGHIPMAYRIGECNKELTANALCEFSSDYKQRSSSDCVKKNVSSQPNGSFKIYHRRTGMIPNYAGHVPGEIFQFGSTYGKNTVNAKQWLMGNETALRKQFPKNYE